MEFTINYFALFVAASASVAIGVLWYGPFFGKEWMRLSGLTPESMKTMALKPWQAMLGGFLNSVLLVFVLLMFINAFSFDVVGALLMTLWVWLGFVATTQISGFLWEGKPFRLFLIHTSYSLVSYLVAATILVLWR